MIRRFEFLVGLVWPRRLIFCQKMELSVIFGNGNISLEYKVSMTFCSALMDLNGTNRRTDIAVCNTLPEGWRYQVTVQLVTSRTNAQLFDREKCTLTGLVDRYFVFRSHFLQRCGKVHKIFSTDGDLRPRSKFCLISLTIKAGCK